MTDWLDLKSDADISLMSETLGISGITASVLANRGIRSKNAAVKYLNPQKKFMYDEALLKDIGKAAEAVREALAKGLRIAVYGDYDVDGIMSTVILQKTLQKLCADVIYYIPGREEEGYGLNAEAVKRLHAEGARLLITCDNGVSANAEISLAKELGMTVVVIDHHEVFSSGGALPALPPADAVIDPKREDCGYPFKRLCAAALCYKFARYLHSLLEITFADDDEYFIFAAIASICDIVALQDENRIFAKHGLELMNGGKIKNLGLNALASARGLEGKKIGAFEIGFVIGPCINATGRLERASTAVELFLCGDEIRAAELAAKLTELNEARKRLTGESVRAVLDSLSLSERAGDNVHLIFDENLHESIAGIVAGRVKDVTGRPVIVFTKSGGLCEGLAKGSARSIQGYNIFLELNRHRELFTRFGGHEMAAGLTLKKENIEILRERLLAACNLKPDDFNKKIFIDGELELPEITFELAKELSLAAPFGRGNEEPVFRAFAVAENVEAIGADKKTLRFTFGAGQGSEIKGQKLKGICFGMAREFTDMLENSCGAEESVFFAENGRLRKALCLEIAFCIEINEFNGNSNLQLRLVDFRTQTNCP